MTSNPNSPFHICPPTTSRASWIYRKVKSLTSVVDIVDDVEVVLHRSAVGAAEAAGEEQQQRQSHGQPAARQDAQPHVSHSAWQHDVQVWQGTENARREPESGA